MQFLIFFRLALLSLLDVLQENDSMRFVTRNIYLSFSIDEALDNIHTLFRNEAPQFEGFVDRVRSQIVTCVEVERSHLRFIVYKRFITSLERCAVSKRTKKSDGPAENLIKEAIASIKENSRSEWVLAIISPIMRKIWEDRMDHMKSIAEASKRLSSINQSEILQNLNREHELEARYLLLSSLHNKNHKNVTNLSPQHIKKSEAFGGDIEWTRSLRPIVNSQIEYDRKVRQTALLKHNSLGRDQSTTVSPFLQQLREHVSIRLKHYNTNIYDYLPQMT
jgi:hypothetical protein